MNQKKTPRRLIVGITGATGPIYGVRILQALKATDVESHLIVSRWGARTLLHETPHSLAEVKAMATRAYSENDQGAAVSSGSFPTLGMVIAPCSMKTLSAIAHGHSDDLIHRAADVVIKERRRLVLVVREAPLSEIHLENMLKLARMGVVIMPPVPAFYDHPRSIDDIVNHTVGRLLDLFDVHIDQAARWTGAMGVGVAKGIERKPAAKTAGDPAGKTAGKTALPRASRRSRR
jgi:flavin prenyltransferase